MCCFPGLEELPTNFGNAANKPSMRIRVIGTNSARQGCPISSPPRRQGQPVHTATRKRERERVSFAMFKRKRKIEGFQRSRFLSSCAREEKRGTKSSSLSLSLFCFSFRFCGALFSSPPAGKRQQYHQRGSEKRPQLERDFSAPIKENREKTTMHFARTPHHRGALVFSRTLRVDFLLTIVFYRVMSATISIRRAVPPVPFVRVNARVFARNKRRKSTSPIFIY